MKLHLLKALSFIILASTFANAQVSAKAGELTTKGLTVPGHDRELIGELVPETGELGSIEAMSCVPSPDRPCFG